MLIFFSLLLKHIILVLREGRGGLKREAASLMIFDLNYTATLGIKLWSLSGLFDTAVVNKYVLFTNITRR